MKAALLGPFPLTFDDVETQVPVGRCGIYALGHVDLSDVFRVERVGREDVDLRRGLRSLIGSSVRFKFWPVDDPQRAFELECELFHRLRPPGNFMHPDRPQGTDWRCPVCSHQRLR